MHSDMTPPERGGGGRRKNPGSRLDRLEIVQAAQTGVCILFTGPAHAKTLARRIHDMSERRTGPFVPVDCGWPESVLERQLFDLLRDRGDGTDDVPRLLPAGTVFLSEVGKLSLALQARLNDTLELAATRGGPRRPRHRVMAWTSQSLLQRVVEGTFNDRLFYRLNVIHMVLPPARRDE